MKTNRKILFISFLILVGFLFFDISQTQAGICSCCYRARGEPANISGCESMCRDFGGVMYWQPTDDPTSGETHECLPPVGMCWCCWADGPESGMMEQSACIAACTDKGQVDRFRSPITSLNLTRDCLPRPTEGAPGEEAPPGEEEATLEETPTGEAAPTGVLSGGLLKAAGRAGYESTSLENIVSNIIYVILGFVGVVFLGMILFAGFTWMIARGNEQDIEKAKKMLEAAIIGMVIVFAAYAVTYFVTSRLLGEAETTTSACPTGEIDCIAVCPSDAYPRDLCVPSTESCICE